MRRKGFWTAQGGTGESRHNFTFTNIGSHNVAVLKTDSSRNVPLENAGFTLYDTEDNIVQKPDGPFICGKMRSV